MKEYHISEPRINDRIRVPEVRLVGPNGEQVGIVRVEDALRLAQEADLDLVEVAPQARPPVCKLMDFGKFKYESAIKDREARKNQAHTVLKEIRLRLKIDPHDYGTKKGHVERFLNAGDKVKVMIMFRGREQSRPEMGYRLLQRMAADVAELGYVESTPKQDGRNMIMVIGPHKKKADAKAEQKAARPPRRQDEIDLDQSVEVEEAKSEQPVPVPVAARPAPTAPASDEEPIFVKRVTPPPSAQSAGNSATSSYSRPPSSSRPPSTSRPPSSSGPAGARPASAGRPSSGPSSFSGPSSGSSSSGQSSGPSSAPPGRPSPAPASSAPSTAPASTPTSTPASRPTPAARPAPVRPAPSPGPGATPGTAPRPGPTARPMPGPAPKPGPAPRPGPGPTPGPAPSPKPKDEAAKAAESTSEQAAADA
jgi:translation initiation factor IF-3